MADRRGPWDNPPPERTTRGRVVLWLALLALAGIGLWQLAELFPGQASGADRAYLIQSLGVLALVSSGILFARRINFGETVRNIAIWLAILAVLVVGFTYQDTLRDVALRVRSELIPGYAVETEPGVLKLTAGRDGHFHVIGTANGVTVNFLIDTGASDVVLSPADAARLGVDVGALNYSRLSQTANGIGRGAPFVLNVLSIGPIERRDVAVTVNGAEMSGSLLGMSFLRNLASIEIQGREMILRWR